MLEQVIGWSLLALSALGLIIVGMLLIGFLNLPEDQCCNGSCKHYDS